MVESFGEGDFEQVTLGLQEDRALRELYTQVVLFMLCGTGGRCSGVQPQSAVQAVLWERPLERGTRVAPN